MAIARRGLPDYLRRKCDGADVVQETLLEAHRGFSGFDGAGADDLRVWLCGILRHNLLDLIRRYRETSKRSIDRERSLESGPDSSGYSGRAVNPCLTPSSFSVARERMVALQDALARLPVNERTVIVLRHFEIPLLPGGRPPPGPLLRGGPEALVAGARPAEADARHRPGARIALRSGAEAGPTHAVGRRPGADDPLLSRRAIRYIRYS